MNHREHGEHRERWPNLCVLCDLCGYKFQSILQSRSVYLPTLLPTGFVSLVKESLREAKRHHISKALILSSETTIRLRIYEGQGITCIYPPTTDQLYLNQLIREVAGGSVNDTQSKTLTKMISRLRETHLFDGVLLACTELPLINHHLPIGPNTLPLIDTSQVLAKTLVDKALNHETS